MVQINYPETDFKIKEEGGKESIFDVLRKRWVALSPEEWVRQNFIQYLIQVNDYPSSLIAVEKELKLGDLKKRFDVLIYDKEHQPWMMVECKAMNVKLGEDVLQQLLRYNISIPVNYLVITNGNSCYVWKRQNGKLNVQNELPVFGTK